MNETWHIAKTSTTVFYEKETPLGFGLVCHLHEHDQEFTASVLLHVEARSRIEYFDTLAKAQEWVERLLTPPLERMVGR